MKNVKKLFLVRGAPGSGKTTLAESICKNVVSADEYFVGQDGVYRFDGSKIKHAHQYCKMRAASLMIHEEDVAVANTFTKKWEMDDYYKLAEEMGYTVFSIIVENRHGGKNVHGVPEDKVQQMRDRFEIEL